MTPEETARVEIDAMLTACGWAIQNYRALNLSTARGIAIREVPLETGPCDYLLLVDRKPVGIVEAKKKGTTLSTAADQSGRYAAVSPDFLAAGLTGPLPFLYESTGVETFFRDERDPEPRSRRVFTFHRPETLAAWAAESDTLRARMESVVTANLQRASGLRQSILKRRSPGNWYDSLWPHLIRFGYGPPGPPPPVHPPKSFHGRPGMSTPTTSTTFVRTPWNTALAGDCNELPATSNWRVAPYLSNLLC